MGGRQGAVLSLMTEGRRSRSASGPSIRASRPPSPPIEQENPFIGMEVPASSNVVHRRQTGRQVLKGRREKVVQSMYSSATCPPSPVASPHPARRPRSMLASSSYARPYKPSTLPSTPSLLSVAYPRSRSQPPVKRRPRSLLQPGLHETPTHVMTQSCLGTLQQGCESNTRHDMASHMKEKMEKPREKVIHTGKEEKENKIEGLFRRKGGSSKMGKSFIRSQGVANVKSQVFDKRQNVTKTPYQHLQASQMRLPQFPFLQTLV